MYPFVRVLVELGLRRVRWKVERRNERPIECGSWAVAKGPLLEKIVVLASLYLLLSTSL